jgi:hypothetical protein
MKPERIYSNAELESFVAEPVRDSLVRALAQDLLNTRLAADVFADSVSESVRNHLEWWKHSSSR